MPLYQGICGAVDIISRRSHHVVTERARGAWNRTIRGERVYTYSLSCHHRRPVTWTKMVERAGCWEDGSISTGPSQQPATNK